MGGELLKALHRRHTKGQGRCVLVLGGRWCLAVGHPTPRLCKLLAPPLARQALGPSRRPAAHPCCATNTVPSYWAGHGWAWDPEGRPQKATPSGETCGPSAWIGRRATAEHSAACSSVVALTSVPGSGVSGPPIANPWPGARRSVGPVPSLHAAVPGRSGAVSGRRSWLSVVHGMGCTAPRPAGHTQHTATAAQQRRRRRTSGTRAKPSRLPLCR